MDSYIQDVVVHTAPKPCIYALQRKTFFRVEPHAPPHTHFPPWTESPAGLVMACAVLVGIRLGRQKTEDDRLDWRTLQVSHKFGFSISKPLVQKEIGCQVCA